MESNDKGSFLWRVLGEVRKSNVSEPIERSESDDQRELDEEVIYYISPFGVLVGQGVLARPTHLIACPHSVRTSSPPLRGGPSPPALRAGGTGYAASRTPSAPSRSVGRQPPRYAGWGYAPISPPRNAGAGLSAAVRGRCVRAPVP